MDINSLGKPLWEMEDREAFALIKTIRDSRRTKKRTYVSKKSTTKPPSVKKAKVPKKPKDIIGSLNANQKSELLKLIEEMEKNETNI